MRGRYLGRFISRRNLMKMISQKVKHVVHFENLVIVL